MARKRYCIVYAVVTLNTQKPLSLLAYRRAPVDGAAENIPPTHLVLIDELVGPSLSLMLPINLTAKPYSRQSSWWIHRSARSAVDDEYEKVAHGAPASENSTWGSEPKMYFKLIYVLRPRKPVSRGC